MICERVEEVHIKCTPLLKCIPPSLYLYSDRLWLFETYKLREQHEILCNMLLLVHEYHYQNCVSLRTVSISELCLRTMSLSELYLSQNCVSELCLSQNCVSFRTLSQNCVCLSLSVSLPDCLFVCLTDARDDVIHGVCTAELQFH